MVRGADLKLAVQDELDWEPGLDTAAIGVSASDGTVTLWGRVRSDAERSQAETAAKRIHGVRAVANELAVHVRPGDVRDDTDLAEQAAKALASAAGVPAERIVATVRGGWITLEGRVPSSLHRDAADRAVRALGGVRGIVNLIVPDPAAQQGT